MKKSITLIVFFVATVSIAILIHTDNNQDQNNALTSKTQEFDSGNKINDTNNNINESNSELSHPKELDPYSNKAGIYHARNPSKNFEAFYQLKSKVILSSSDTIEKSRLLDSHYLYELATSTLSSIDLAELRLNHKTQRQRMDAVSFLSEVLDPENNSIQIEMGINFCKEFLSKTLTRANQSTDLKKSLIGDQIEIGLSLAQHHPVIWEEIQKNTQNLYNEKIISYIQTLASFKEGEAHHEI